MEDELTNSKSCHGHSGVTEITWQTSSHVFTRAQEGQRKIGILNLLLRVSAILGETGWRRERVVKWRQRRSAAVREEETRRVKTWDVGSREPEDYGNVGNVWELWAGACSLSATTVMVRNSLLFQFPDPIFSSSSHIYHFKSVEHLY